MDYRDLITRLRSVESRSKGELLEQAAQAIEELLVLAQNGQSAIDTNQRLVKELEMCRAEREALYNLARNYPGGRKEIKT